MILITGVSGGIGEALVNQYLADGKQVIGLGRRNAIEHPNYRFIWMDLSDINPVKEFKLDLTGIKSFTLINNAGTIGSIQRMSEQSESDAPEVITVNTIAPMVLTQRILAQLPIDVPFDLVNISSGAGRRPIPGWAAYCASKAALNLFSQTVYLEEKERGRPIRVYAVEPGVVDTAMQRTIRGADSSTFSSLDSFIELKATNQLLTPQEVVRRLLLLLARDYDETTVYSLRDIQG